MQTSETREEHSRRTIQRQRDRERLPRVAAARRRADGLGWLSIGLGAALLFGTRAIAQWTGIGHGRTRYAVMRAVGVREIVSGIAILTRSSRPSPWVWARVGGDVVDLALLSCALAAPRGNVNRLMVSMGAVAGVAVVDALTANQLRQRMHASHVAAVTINVLPEEARRRWSELNVVDLHPRFIAAPGGRGTEVRVEVEHGLHGVEKRLREFKQLLETGEIMKSDASIHTLPHAARPSRNEQTLAGRKLGNGELDDDRKFHERQVTR